MEDRKPFQDKSLISLAIDIYNRRIDGFETGWAAKQYSVDRRKILRALTEISSGQIFDREAYPFGAYDPSMCGVSVCDGSTFTHGDSAEFSEGRRGAANHYVWFCN